MEEHPPFRGFIYPASIISLSTRTKVRRCPGLSLKGAKKDEIVSFSPLSALTEHPSDCRMSLRNLSEGDGINERSDSALVC